MFNDSYYNSLPMWDGTAPNGYHYPFPADIAKMDMRIDTDGSIWYRTHETPRKWSIWCPASRLCNHLHHLNQIMAR